MDSGILIKYKFVFSHILLLLLLINGCANKKDAEVTADTPKANVVVTSINRENLNDTIFLTASSFYNNKTIIIAPISGYLSEVNVTNGLNVSKNFKAFEVLTKEYNALKSSKDILDSLYIGKRTGKIEISAPSSGQISDLTTLQGQYVQEGSALCTIIDMSSLLFKLYVPLQYNSDISSGMKCTLMMPDGEIINGFIKNMLAKTELNSQTEVYFLRPSAGIKIPEGVNVKAYIVKQKGFDSQVLPKNAVLSNETLNEYWVMKLINDSTAVKVPIKIGIANQNIVEIKEPQFSLEDRIITTGNYGLPDTALVNITVESDEK
ncbi:MAG TPA: HlyD family efflux transporter periplasmic adaptor subunit [Ignavibacteria bacterium]